MQTQTINIYAHFQVAAPENAAGNLTYYIPDIYNPDLLRLRPAVLILPGGGYTYTSPREAESVALQFTAKGYCAFILHYSCAPHRFPVALTEAAMAMRYIRENAAEWKIDPHMVAAIGFSAGGHLCGTLGTMYDCPEVSHIGDAALLRPDALGLCYPVTVSNGKTHAHSFKQLCGEDNALRQRLSLDTLVRSDMPPVFLWHTRNDETVPVLGTIRLAAALENADVTFALHVYRNGQHGAGTADALVYATYCVPTFSDDVQTWVGAMIAFFAESGLQIADTKRQ